jgi:nucleotide-binding universal stress UspA family protein
MITRLLLAYDGSEPAMRAFEFALDLARHYHAALHLVAVVRPPDFGTEVETEAIIEHSRHHYRHLLKKLSARLQNEDIEVVSEIVVGHPAEQILHYADRHHVDHIVVGHRGRTIFGRLLIGSVARQVIAHASCAVTVVGVEARTGPGNRPPTRQISATRRISD